ncbi:cache domain-containing sensor histidine kinase [Haloimpatiens myeolchijeotgali]|uniref:cache domain-containing sensor histidine kinase n=1 Tax=Haloimpatiens sp. FM7330 TaxID=3298610 RepID=UPI00384F27C3
MKNREKSKFGYKLLKFFILIGMIPLIVMTVCTYWNTSRIVNDKVNKSVKNNLEVMSKLIDSSISNLEGIVKYVSDSEDVNRILRKKDYANYDERFEDIQTLYKTTSIFLSNGAHQKIPFYLIGQNKLAKFTNEESIPEIYTNMNSEIFKNINKYEEKKYVTYVQRRVGGEERKDVVLSMGKQIKDVISDEKLGYIIIDIHDEYFDEIFKSTQIYNDSNVYILDSKGTIITDKLKKNRTGFKFYDKYVEKILEQDKGNFLGTIAGQKSAIYFSTIHNSGFKIVKIIPLRSINKDKNVIIRVFFILFLLLGIMGVSAAIVLSRNISKPINDLSKLMKKVETGSLDVRYNVNTNDEIEILGDSFNKMVIELDSLIKEVYLKQYLLKESELKALKAQINPHFLYNTLESINCMAKLKDNKGVSKMVIALGKFLRYSMSKKGDIVSIEECMGEVKNYLDIQKVRFGDKFECSISIEDGVKDKNILKLLVQPIVENALIHGLEPKIGKGTLQIKVYKNKEDICIDVIDNGVGVKDNVTSTKSIGMSNVNKRIKLQYGEQYGVNIKNFKNPTCIQIKIPFNDNILDKNCCLESGDRFDKSNDCR